MSANLGEGRPVDKGANLPLYDGQRRPTDGEVCTCGRPAVLVYVFTDPDGTVREVPYCGIPDGGAR